MQGSYHVSLPRRVLRGLQRLPRQDVERLWRAVRLLQANPFPPGCAKLRGSDDLWRVRVGDYRIIYQVNTTNRTVNIAAIRHRREAYQAL